MMQRFLVLAFAVASAIAVRPASAAIYNATFSGAVCTSSSCVSTTAQTATGTFQYNTATGAFTYFTVGGQSIPAGFDSSAVVVPALTDAIYEAQISPVALNVGVNDTFSLDLSSLTLWPASASALSLLTNTAQLTSNLDDTVTDPSLSGFPSTFGYYTANADGSNVHALTAALTSISVTTVVPEPASLSLFAGALLGLGLLRRRT